MHAGRATPLLYLFVVVGAVATHHDVFYDDYGNPVRPPLEVATQPATWTSIIANWQVAMRDPDVDIQSFAVADDIANLLNPDDYNELCDPETVRQHAARNLLILCAKITRIVGATTLNIGSRFIIWVVRNAPTVYRRIRQLKVEAQEKYRLLQYIPMPDLPRHRALTQADRQDPLNEDELLDQTSTPPAPLPPAAPSPPPGSYRFPDYANRQMPDSDADEDPGSLLNRIVQFFSSDQFDTVAMLVLVPMIAMVLIMIWSTYKELAMEHDVAEDAETSSVA
ncbi:Uncharacterized protein PBTT_06735 [Plasmodiophora brassicae]|uniref:Uncharacterized protein n=1 Tax=Plasmodiophora brassicae TaxID=37360 RepID=A0A0G4IW99_PLABS|nr:hypothetical protein PBRA_001320 [Plasmodiophora brassicae]SPQ97419.1 unnamed protein product [Plasmodiophora brassicae]